MASVGYETGGKEKGDLYGREEERTVEAGRLITLRGGEKSRNKFVMASSFGTKRTIQHHHAGCGKVDKSIYKCLYLFIYLFIHSSI